MLIHLQAINYLMSQVWHIIQRVLRDYGHRGIDVAEVQESPKQLVVTGNCQRLLWMFDSFLCAQGCQGTNSQVSVVGFQSAHRARWQGHSGWGPMQPQTGCLKSFQQVANTCLPGSCWSQRVRPTIRKKEETGNVFFLMYVNRNISVWSKTRKKENLKKVLSILKKTKIILGNAELHCGIIINFCDPERSFEEASTVPIN